MTCVSFRKLVFGVGKRPLHDMSKSKSCESENSYMSPTGNSLNVSRVNGGEIAGILF